MFFPCANTTAFIVVLCKTVVLTLLLVSRQPCVLYLVGLKGAYLDL